LDGRGSITLLGTPLATANRILYESSEPKISWHEHPARASPHRLEANATDAESERLFRRYTLLSFRKFS